MKFTGLFRYNRFSCPGNYFCLDRNRNAIGGKVTVESSKGGRSDEGRAEDGVVVAFQPTLVDSAFGHSLPGALSKQFFF
ncbi:MAG: hypothetical protein SGI88_01180 [Candidatus Hydrogenedentes bacterium]|nr:hypothetical protein [Candidatus Hydrogenedentota bacterium]